MTVSVTSGSSGPYAGNGSTTVFPFDFAARSSAEVAVYVDGVEVTSGFSAAVDTTDYQGGNVTFAVAPESGASIVIISNPSFAQATSFQNAGPFLAQSHDEALDRAAIRDIALNERIGRAIKAAPGETLADLPIAEDRAGKLMAFDASGDPVVTTGGEAADATLRSDLAASTGSALVRVEDATAPAYLKTLSDIVNGLPIDFFRFVEAGDVAAIRALTSVADLSPNFADAVASGALEINLQPGLYNVTDTIALTASMLLKGAGPNWTEIKITSTTAPAITLANNVTKFGLKGFKLTRDGVAGATAHGIDFLGITDKSEVEDIVLENHYDNLRVSTCATGFIRKIESRKAYRYGVLQTHHYSAGASQWDVDNILVEMNTVDGWRAESVAGPAGMILGAMRNLRSYANGGRGLHLVGQASVPIYDLRLSDAFLGDDAQGCVRLDTYGGKHRMSGFFERAGRGPTGRTLATPASNTAPNIEIASSNIDVTIYGSTIDEASYDGIQHDGGRLIVGTSMIYNNGQASAAGRRNGILSQGGRLVLNGNTITNLSGASQLYGLAAAHDDITYGVNDMEGNATAASALSGGTTDVMGLVNKGEATAYNPATVDKLKFNSAWTPAATGGDKGAGTVNVSGNIYKNNVAFTNP